MVMLRPLLGYFCWNSIHSALSEFWVQALSLRSPVFGNSRERQFFFDGDATGAGFWPQSKPACASFIP
jgi:hypothetical protein